MTDIPLPGSQAISRLPVVPFRAQPKVTSANGRIPFVDKNNPLVRRWLVQAQCFDLLNPEDSKKYAEVFQAATDRVARIEAHVVPPAPQDGHWWAHVRWATQELQAPAPKAGTALPLPTG